MVDALHKVLDASEFTSFVFSASASQKGTHQPQSVRLTPSGHLLLMGAHISMDRINHNQPPIDIFLQAFDAAAKAEKRLK